MMGIYRIGEKLMSFHNVIIQLYVESWQDGSLSEGQYKQLQEIQKSDLLTPLENCFLDRLFHAVQRRWLQVV